MKLLRHPTTRPTTTAAKIIGNIPSAKLSTANIFAIEIPAQQMLSILKGVRQV